MGANIVEKSSQLRTELTEERRMILEAPEAYRALETKRPMPLVPLRVGDELDAPFRPPPNMDFGGLPSD